MSFLFLFSRSSYRAATQPKLTELKKFTLFAPRAPRRGSSEAAILANKLTIIVHRAPTARAATMSFSGQAAVEVVLTVAMHLLTASAVACGLATNDDGSPREADLAEARNHLVKLSGKSHTLETAIVISEEGKPVWRHLARPKLTVRKLSEPFIESYVETVAEPLLSTVGAYQLEGRGAQLFTRIEGDYFSILGLPLLPLLDYLRTRGVLMS